MRVIPKESRHAFEIAFGVRDPWRLSSLAISKASRRFEVSFDYRFGSNQLCPFCGYDLRDIFFSSKKSWHYLNFFDYETQMTASIPIFRCSNSSCIASVEREAILNTMFLDILLMITPSDCNHALKMLLNKEMH